MEVFSNDKNSWLQSAKNIRFNNNILEADLRTMTGDWKYNKLEIHPLLLNKHLHNSNGIFKYGLSREEDDTVMKQLFPVYNGPTIPYINIHKCVMLSVDIPKYNKAREETLHILNNYKLPPIHVHFGHTKETSHTSKFYDLVNTRNAPTLGMLDIFDNFVNNSVNNEWLFFVEDDVRPINIDVHQDLSKLYNIPKDAEIIRPYIGKNENCDITNINYNISYGGGLAHALYISVSGCRKVLNYAKKYKWKFIGDVDLFKLAKYCGGYPTGYDGWSLNSCNGNNDITEQLQEDEKINMYQMGHCIFNQTSCPCV